jgi:S1/P1 Nuclease
MSKEVKKRTNPSHNRGMSQLSIIHKTIERIRMRDCFRPRYFNGLLFAAVTIVSAALPHRAEAWGTEGHRVTGLVASELLTPRARLRLNQIIPGGDIAEISLYMDTNRKELSEKIPGSEKWHYDNQPVCKTLTFAQYCPNDDCASAQLPVVFNALKDGAAPPSPLADRALALRFLVHMIGDIHQPLHAADDGDLGANLKFVLIPESDQGRRLHGVWDTDIVKRALRGVNEAAYAKELLTRFKDRIPAWQSGTVRDWMAESHSLSKFVTYGTLPRFECGKEWASTIVTPVPLPEEYMSRAAETVPAQLAKAGARIAWMLNQALDTAAAPATPAAPAPVSAPKPSGDS